VFLINEQSQNGNFLSAHPTQAENTIIATKTSKLKQKEVIFNGLS
jgi:hypothetical protein